MAINVGIEDDHIAIRGFGNTIHFLSEEEAKDFYIQLGTALRIYDTVIKKVKR